MCAAQCNFDCERATRNPKKEKKKKKKVIGKCLMPTQVEIIDKILAINTDSHYMKSILIHASRALAVGNPILKKVSWLNSLGSFCYI